MACPDMTVENNVLSALNKVKKYKKLGKENIALCGALISLAIDSLNLWVDKTAGEQGLNLELLNAEKEKLK